MKAPRAALYILWHSFGDNRGARLVLRAGPGIRTRNSSHGRLPGGLLIGSANDSDWARRRITDGPHRAAGMDAECCLIFASPLAQCWLAPADRGGLRLGRDGAGGTSPNRHAGRRVAHARFATPPIGPPRRPLAARTSKGNCKDRGTGGLASQTSPSRVRTRVRPRDQQNRAARRGRGYGERLAGARPTAGNRHAEALVVAAAPAEPAAARPRPSQSRSWRRCRDRRPRLSKRRKRRPESKPRASTTSHSSQRAVGVLPASHSWTRLCATATRASRRAAPARTPRQAAVKQAVKKKTTRRRYRFAPSPPFVNTGYR